MIPAIMATGSIANDTIHLKSIYVPWQHRIYNLKDVCSLLSALKKFSVQTKTSAKKKEATLSSKEKVKKWYSTKNLTSRTSKAKPNYLCRSIFVTERAEISGNLSNCLKQADTLLSLSTQLVWNQSSCYEDSASYLLISYGIWCRWLMSQLTHKTNETCLWDPLFFYTSTPFF